MNAESDHPPVVVALPNTTELKMKAIVSLAGAVETLAKALVSVSTEVTIANCVISNTKVGISIGGEESNE